MYGGALWVNESVATLNAYAKNPVAYLGNSIVRTIKLLKPPTLPLLLSERRKVRRPFDMQFSEDWYETGFTEPIHTYSYPSLVHGSIEAAAFRAKPPKDSDSPSIEFVRLESQYGKWFAAVTTDAPMTSFGIPEVVVDADLFVCGALSYRGTIPWNYCGGAVGNKYVVTEKYVSQNPYVDS